MLLIVSDAAFVLGLGVLWPRSEHESKPSKLAVKGPLGARGIACSAQRLSLAGRHIKVLAGDSGDGELDVEAQAKEEWADRLRADSSLPGGKHEGMGVASAKEMTSL